MQSKKAETLKTIENINRIEEGSPQRPVSKPYLESLPREQAAILQTIATVINLNEPTFSQFTNTINEVKTAVKNAPLGVALYAVLFVADMLAIGVENELPEIRVLLEGVPKENQQAPTKTSELTDQ